MNMSKETLIKDHMIHMMGLFNKMKILKANIDGETQVDMVLKTLLDFLKQFKLKYSMNKMVMSLIELIRELQTIEGILKKQRDIHMVVKGSLGSSNYKKKNTIETLSKKRILREKGRRRARDRASVSFVVGKANERRNA